MSLSPGDIDGKCRIVRLIGEGGIGSIYEGEKVRIARAKQVQSEQAEEEARAERERADRLRAAAPRPAAPNAMSQPKATATSAQTAAPATTGRKIRTEL